MTNKTILDAVHETAKGLHKAGAMDATTMREFDALCLPPVKHYSAGQIKKLRLRYKASQSVFAAYLNTSPSTVQKWEQGKKTTERSIAEAAQYRRSERSRRAWLTQARQADCHRENLRKGPLPSAKSDRDNWVGAFSATLISCPYLYPHFAVPGTTFIMPIVPPQIPPN